MSDSEVRIYDDTSRLSERLKVAEYNVKNGLVDVGDICALAGNDKVKVVLLNRQYDKNIKI